MLFVRNPTGVSHAPAEHAERADCLAGVAALADVAPSSPHADVGARTRRLRQLGPYAAGAVTVPRSEVRGGRRTRCCPAVPRAT